MLIGNLRKMRTELSEGVVQYSLPVGDELISLNELFGKTLSMTFTGKINCVQCGRKTNKSFQQGYCFPCYREMDGCSHCNIFPEKCHAENGGCDSDHWVHANCLVPHVVYLANSSGLKVGITRASQVPTRWIDQGAVQALPIFTASNRYQSGVLESALTQFVNDKTNWRAMLKARPNHLDLFLERDQLMKTAAAEIESVITQFSDDAIKQITDAELTEISFPVNKYPEKIKSFNFDKVAEVRGELVGIKGQYLIFDEGVINIRKFGGYEVVTRPP